MDLERGVVLREQGALFAHLVRWVVVGGVVGVLAGLSSAAFLESLRWATETRVEHGWLLWLLPVAGFAVGYVYHAFGGRSAGGNNLIIDEIHEPTEWIPRRMAPLVYAATIVTHLFGGSAGREGTAIQMSGSLSDGIVNRLARFSGTERRLVLIAAISGAFGAVFGVPIAGFVFGIEVQTVGRIRHDAIVPALTASIVGDQAVRLLDVEHTPVPIIAGVDLGGWMVPKLVLAGVVFGLASLVFVELVHGLKRLFVRWVAWPPLRPAIGGAAVIGLTYAVGTRDYLGLSIPLITDSLGDGSLARTAATVALLAFLWKIVFTVVTLGSGFHGGEVTPLFVIGATLGATLGDVLDVPVALLAAVGFVAVFAGATNTPIACTIMGVELFGAGPIVPLAIGCVAAYTCSGHRGIYVSQRISSSKTGDVLDPEHTSPPTLRRDVR
jgi:H+/Cl- antiporter ClcA